MKNKHAKKNQIDLYKIGIIILSIILLIGIIYIIYDIYRTKKDVRDNTNILEEIEIKEEEITPIKTERMLQLEELQTINNEIVGWLEIEGTNINYPVLHGTDNDFYLNHNYKKESSWAGSLFLDKDFDIINGSSNYLIYGHRNGQGLMFEGLLKYANRNFYENHKTIKFTTLNEDSIYEILAVFYSRVYYQNEQNVFRYYYFVNAKDEQEYNEFVNNAKTASIYDTGVIAEYGEQLLTLSTCEYSQKNGRFVVVAKKVKT